MQIKPILNTGHLYAVEDVFPQALLDQIFNVDWTALEYTRLSIGSSLRREIMFNSNNIYEYIRDSITPQVEQACQVKFTDLQQSAINWWIDEPGFRPRMHTDGDKPSALQIYLQPDRTDLGTAFYSTSNTKDLTHYFASCPNTGYIMFNSHEPRPELWHDMQQPVPEGVLRLCLYISFGPYVTV